jgi:aspartate aminotransferase
MKSLSRKALAIEPSQTLALFARAKAMKAEGHDVVSFTAGEPDFPTPAPVKEAGINAINENFTKYTPTRGMPELLKAIAEKFRKENGIETEPGRILVSSGAKHSIFNALQAMCNRGDEVVIPSPYWVSYPEMVQMVDARPVLVRTSLKNQFKITASQLKRAITRKTKAVILNSPCNPTGAVYSREEIEAIAEIVRVSGVYLISDEIYERILFDREQHFSPGSIAAIRDQVITVNGVSKAYSMTGWRIGFMTGHRSVIDIAETFQGQVTSSANSVAQKAALAALTGNLDGIVHTMVAEFDRRRVYLTERFREIPEIRYIQPKGAFYLFFDASAYLGKRKDNMAIKTADDLCEFLLTRHNVALVPGTGFGEKRWIRLSYACSMEDLKKGTERIREGLQRLRQ